MISETKRIEKHIRERLKRIRQLESQGDEKSIEYAKVLKSLVKEEQKKL